MKYEYKHRVVAAHSDYEVHRLIADMNDGWAVDSIIENMTVPVSTGSFSVPFKDLVGAVVILFRPVPGQEGSDP